MPTFKAGDELLKVIRKMGEKRLLIIGNVQMI